MAKLTKRKQMFREKVDRTRFYPANEAFSLLQELSSTRFTETVEASVNLGVDPRKSDQMVRGSTVMPNGTGKDVRVAVFTPESNAQAARDAGADVVGLEDLAERVQGGEMDFDMVIATPDAMGVVGRLGPVLGPRGLMPNPKVGTVTSDIASAVRNAKAGQVRYRVDKGGVIHTPIGRADFDANALTQNLDALISDLQKIKPATSKGKYMKKVTVSTTMGPGVPVDLGSLSI